MQAEIRPRNDLELDGAGGVRSAADVAAERPSAAGTASADVRADGLTIVVPPRGVLRGSHGILFFACMWTLVVTVITAIYAFIFVPAPQFQPGQTGGRIAFFGAAGCFALLLLALWAIALLLILTGVDRGRRRAIIDVVAPATPDAALLFTVKRLLKTEQHQWPVADVSSISAGVSQEQVDNKVFYEVRIRARDGKCESFFSGRPKEEVEWIAAVLRAAMGLPAEGKESGG